VRRLGAALLGESLGFLGSLRPAHQQAALQVAHDRRLAPLSRVDHVLRATRLLENRHAWLVLLERYVLLLISGTFALPTGLFDLALLFDSLGSDRVAIYIYDACPRRFMLGRNYRDLGGGHTCLILLIAQVRVHALTFISKPGRR